MRVSLDNLASNNRTDPGTRTYKHTHTHLHTT